MKYKLFDTEIFRIHYQLQKQRKLDKGIVQIVRIYKISPKRSGQNHGSNLKK